MVVSRPIPSTMKIAGETRNLCLVPMAQRCAKSLLPTLKLAKGTSKSTAPTCAVTGAESLARRHRVKNVSEFVPNVATSLALFGPESSYEVKARALSVTTFLLALLRCRCRSLTLITPIIKVATRT